MGPETGEEDDSYYKDDWPKIDGRPYDGKDLLQLVRSGKSPFAEAWRVEALLEEVQTHLGVTVENISSVEKGSNNYGLLVSVSDGRALVARLANGDVNMPKFDGFEVQDQALDVEFDTAVHNLLAPESGIPVSNLLYSRVPIQRPKPRNDRPTDIAGRRLMVFEKAKGRKAELVWRDLDAERKLELLSKCAARRANLFHFNLPTDFAKQWLLSRLFDHKPDALPIQPAPTREFCIALLTSKIEATIREIGDMIAWEGDDEVVGPRAFAAKHSIIKAIPHLLPKDNDLDLYRLVLDHGDFGTHNLLATHGDGGALDVSCIFDWETGCIIPALLSDPEMAVTVDLIADENGRPAIKRLDDTDTDEDRNVYMGWSSQYFTSLYGSAPEYERIIKAGKDARHLWFALRDWRGADPEGFFGELGDWAGSIIAGGGDSHLMSTRKAVG